MKKHLYLFCLMLLIGAGVLAQPQLSFKFAEPKIEFFVGLGNYLVFDIQVKSDEAGYYLYSGGLSMEYNASAFDVTNVVVFKGTLLEGTFQYGPQVLPRYADPFVTLNSGRISIPIIPGTNNINANPTSPASRFNEVPTDWVSLVTLWVLIDNSSEAAGVYFYESLMNGQIFHTGAVGGIAFQDPNLYEVPTLEYCNLERIYSEAHGWSQIGDAQIDWNTPVNTTIFDGIATITQNNDIEALANNLNILQGANLIIGTNKWLTVNGTLTSADNNALSIVDGGSLLHGTALVNATLQRSLSGGTINPTTHRYHMVAVPLDESSSYAAGDIFENLYLWEFDAAGTQDWASITAGNTPINNKEGYLLWSDEATYTLQIAGKLNAGDYSLPTKNMGINSNNESYRLVPNPYPSALQWTTPAGYDAAVYFYNAATGNYITFADGVPNPAIAPVGQAFFIKKSSSGGVANAISISNSDRLHHNQAFYKSTTDIADLLHISASSEISEDHTYIRFHEMATNYYDSERDALKLKGFGDAPQLYTNFNGSDYAINSLEKTNSNTVVPLFFEMTMDGLVNLEVTGLQSFVEGASIFLEDVYLNEMIDLSEQTNYSFSHEQSIPADRFRLHFYGVLGNETIQSQAIKIWAFEKHIYIKLPEQGNSSATVELFDQLGKRFYHYTHTADNLILINAQNFPKFLIAKVHTAVQVTASKLVNQ